MRNLERSLWVNLMWLKRRDNSTMDVKSCDSNLLIEIWIFSFNKRLQCSATSWVTSNVRPKRETRVWETMGL